MSKGITFTVIFQAGSLNYGEGFGNISELKKITRGDGTQYTFASRQCLRYDIVRLGNILFGWNLNVVDSSKETLQFKKGYTIENSEEMDLFGYMRTEKSSKSDSRTAPVRLSHAVSLEPYKNDMEFLSNMGFANRINANPNLANIEHHQAFYTYTVTIDLEKISFDKIDENNIINLDNKIKYKRLSELLEIIKILNRNIRGRHENLSPLFVIGGIYNLTSPFFLGRIKLNVYNGKTYVNTDLLREVLSSHVCGNRISDNTFIGILNGIFDNQSDIESIIPERTYSIDGFFEKLKEKIKEYYGV